MMWLIFKPHQHENCFETSAIKVETGFASKMRLKTKIKTVSKLPQNCYCGFPYCWIHSFILGHQYQFLTEKYVKAVPG
jgi:predicted nucleic acid binding AN1-type Zn finger protein